MESSTRLFYRNDKVDLRIWPIIHFLSDKEVEDINVAIVFGKKGSSALYVTKNDEVFGIGSNKHNMLALGKNKSGTKFKPVKVEELSGKKIKYFSCGYQHVMALTEDGILFNWGSNDLSQLGTKNPSDVVGPSIIGSLFGKKVVRIACSTYYNLVLCDNHEVYEWGNRDEDTSPANAGVETLVEGELKGKEIVSVACGKDGSFALSKDGCVYFWSTDINENSPEKISSLSKIFIKKIVAGFQHVSVLSDSGIIYSWGVGSHGQNWREFSSNPTEVSFRKFNGVFSERIIDIAASPFSHISAAMDENCNVFMWGQCKEQSIRIPLQTHFKSLYEVFVFFDDYAGSYQPITSKCSKKTSIYEHIKNSFDDETTSDLTVCVEDKEIKVHKAVLKIRSNYFNSMFKDGWKENEKKDLEIKDSTYAAYKALMEYFYTDNLNVSYDAAFELLDLAREYCEEELQEMCEIVIKNSITVNNAASSYSTAEIMKIENLKVFCLEFMMNNLSSVVVSDDFGQLDGTTAKEIMKTASLNSIFKT